MTEGEDPLVALYEEHADVIDEYAERDDEIGALARAHRRIARGAADE